MFFSSFTMIIAELPGYLARLGGEQYIGLIVAFFTLTAGLSRPFSGKLTDKWGRIPVMIVGAVASAIAGLLYPLLATVWGFLFIRMIHGFSTGFKPTGTSAYIADIVPPNKRGEALGISSFFGTIGMASGPIIGSTIYLNFGINAMFYCCTAFAIGSVLILIGIKETLVEREKFSFSLLKIDRSDIHEPAVIVPAIVMLFTTFCFGTLITLSPDFSTYLGIENKGLFYAFFTGSSLLVRIVGGRMSDKFGRKSVLYVSTSMLFISMVVIGFSQSPTQFFTGAFLFGLGYGLNSPALFAWTIDLSPEKTRGRGISTLFIFLEVGIGLGALLSGTLYQGMPERFPMIFGAAGFFSLIALFYLLFFTPKK
jgi:MFS family permease